MQQITTIVMYDRQGMLLGETPIEGRFELNDLPPECQYIQIATRDALGGAGSIRTDESTLYFVGHRALGPEAARAGHHVVVDGVEYVPLQAVTVSRLALTRSLVELFRGHQPGQDAVWFEEQVKLLYIQVSDSPSAGAVTVSDFLEALAGR